MSTVNNDIRIRPPAHVPNQARSDSEHGFDEILDALRSERAAGFAATGPSGLGRPSEVSAQTLDPPVASNQRGHDLAALFENQEASLPPPETSAQILGALSEDAHAFAPPAPNGAGAYVSVERSAKTAAPSQPSAATFVQPRTAEPSLAEPISARSAAAPRKGAQSPVAVTLKSKDGTPQLYVRAPSDETGLSVIRRRIEALFAGRGLRVHLHLNGRRIGALEDDYG